ncbi:MAG TPA: glycosyltransferase family 39 protein, partial [Bacteroidia bacterium]|nr:glycosyltransferase family 39 protein [Bacteroidia bacterium]
MSAVIYLPAMIRDRIVAWVLRHERWWLYLALPLVSLVMHWGILGKDLQGMHVWRQTGTQQTIDAFVEEDFCILNPRRLERGTTDGISRVEFPLYQWLIAAMAKVVGHSVLVMRLFTFLLGCFGIWAMRHLLVALTRDRLAGLLGGFFFAFAPVVYYYSVCALPDMLALVLAMWGLVFLLRQGERLDWRNAALAVSLIGISVLVKLPYVIFFPAFVVWAIQEFRKASEKR